MFRLAIAGLLSIGLLTGCMSPGGNTVEEKRQAVHQMRSETLAELYQVHPEARAQIEQAVGYGVFSNVGVNLILLSAGSGWGVVRSLKGDTGSDKPLTETLQQGGLCRPSQAPFH